MTLKFSSNGFRHPGQKGMIVSLKIMRSEKKYFEDQDASLTEINRRREKNGSELVDGLCTWFSSDYGGAIGNTVTVGSYESTKAQRIRCCAIARRRRGC